jgi:hypothetical protein
MWIGSLPFSSRKECERAMPKKQDNQRAVFEFLRDHGKTGLSFTQQEMADAVPDWVEETARTYISKQYGDYLQKVGPKTYRVLPEFKRLSYDEFLELVTQVRHVFAVYNRATYERVVVYDFFLPLTREDKLRKTLDELFYRDTLDRRIREIGLDVMADIVPRTENEAEQAYVDRVIDIIDARIGGFSISHVSGRFRCGPIVTRKQSCDQLASDRHYLMDETTAVVRFIIPCRASRIEHEADFQIEDDSSLDQAALEAEVKQIRGLFFQIFVEAIVPTIRGEELIWMLETSPKGHRLYELVRAERERAS